MYNVSLLPFPNTPSWLFYAVIITIVVSLVIVGARIARNKGKK